MIIMCTNEWVKMNLPSGAMDSTSSAEIEARKHSLPESWHLTKSAKKAFNGNATRKKTCGQEMKNNEQEGMGTTKNCNQSFTQKSSHYATYL